MGKYAAKAGNCTVRDTSLRGAGWISSRQLNDSPRRRRVMLKYLIVALLAFTPAIPALGATPAAEHSTTVHHAATRYSHSSHAHSSHSLTAAQRRARLERLEHERTVRRIAEEQHLRGGRSYRTTRRTTLARRTSTHSTAYERRLAAHRRYEAHLTYERRVSRERDVPGRRAHETRLAYIRRLRAHRSYEARLEREREARRSAYSRRQAELAQAVSQRSSEMELAKADVPRVGMTPVTGTTNPASLDYISHAHIHLYWSSPLRGTHASLVRQDARDRAEGLTRIKNQAELMELVRDRELISLPLNSDIQADPRLAYDRRYTRPWTADFLRDVGIAFMRRFGTPLVITSAVRPASYQEQLRYRNGNAAPVNGIIASPHEFGASIDIGKKGMTAEEKAWMRGYLLPLQQAGQLDVEEEFYEACFHITVYKTYVPAPMGQPQSEVADTQMGATAQ